MSKKKKIIITIIIIILTIAALWIGGIIPKFIARIVATDYLKNNFPKKQFEYVAIEWSSAFDGYIIRFKDEKEKEVGFIINGKYLPISIGQGMNAIEQNYREEFEEKKDTSPTITEYEFIAEIIETDENHIMVKPDANSREIKSGDKILVGITRPTNGTNDFYVVGNKIKITYDGTIMESYPPQIYAKKIELVTSTTKNYTEKIAYANYSSDNTIISECLNKDTMLISSVRHLPVYKFETKEELDSFKDKFKNSFTMDYGYDEAPAFNDIAGNYDNEFFKNKVLMLTYISTNSGSLRYGIKEVKKENGTLCLKAIKTNNPEVYTNDMSGWFLMVEFDKEYLNDCTKFDAQLEQYNCSKTRNIKYI